MSITPTGCWSLKDYGKRNTGLVLIKESWLFAHVTGFARSVMLHHILRDKLLHIQLLTKEIIQPLGWSHISCCSLLRLGRLISRWGVISFQIRMWSNLSYRMLHNFKLCVCLYYQTKEGPSVGDRQDVMRNSFLCGLMQTFQCGV